MDCNFDESYLANSNNENIFDGINRSIMDVQYEKNDILDSMFCFDESGKTTKYVQYNKDETVANAILYEEDKTILETYDHGILKSDTITYNKSCNRVERTYDETGKISSAREEGKGYETHFAYEKKTERGESPPERREAPLRSMIRRGTKEMKTGCALMKTLASLVNEDGGVAA